MIKFRSTSIAIPILIFSLFSSYASAKVEPQVLVESVASQVVKRIKKDQEIIKSDSRHINKVVNELVIPHFDFNRMSRWVLGKYWRKANKSQKKQFVEEFKTLLIRTYATSLSEYIDQEIKYLPFRDKVTSGDVTVRSEIAQAGSFPIPINYRLHNELGEWKVYDITIDDISLVANYRSSFAKHIRKSGIDDLIDTLAKKSQ